MDTAMNEYQQNLYDNLMILVENDESFYFKDFDRDGVIYRIFNYRLCSYSSFLQPGAFNCRGHMFEVDADGKAVRLASMLMEKFFNLNENPFTMDLDLSEVVEVADKADGSLISTYLHPAKFMGAQGTSLSVKSKGSISSEQAIDAANYLMKNENWGFRDELAAAERLGYTVIMEYVAPHNRIVLGYETEELRVLGVRSREDGSYVNYEDVDGDVFPTILSHWVSVYDIDDPIKFVAELPDSKEDIEGVVIRLASGQRVKVKTLKYLALHHTKDSINSPRRLFEAVLEEATDDMRTLFFDDKLALKMITDMEVFVEGKYNHMVDVVERFYERNKEMERKEFAILGQTELDRMYFGLAMNKYVGKDVDYKGFMKKNWKSYGLKDREENENE